MTDADVDIAVVGGGILGLATARELTLREPGRSIMVLEQEQALAQHQTGHNSGVIHAGVYYPENSLKARLCAEGRVLLEAFCAERGIAYERSGKLIVATRRSELPALRELERRATVNGVPGIAWLDPDGIRELEPNVTGVAALHSPHTGIVDFPEVCRAMAAELVEAGQAVRTGTKVIGINQSADGCRIQTSRGEVTAGRVLTCAGAWSDRLATAAGGSAEPRIVPFRGAYLKVSGPSSDLVRGLVYPVPDPQLPFLGVHVTRHIDTSLTIGPTALMVGSLRADRAYSVDLRDALRTASWPGTWRLAWRYRSAARSELHHAVSKKAMIREARQFVPALRSQDISVGFSGVRAQAVTRGGEMVDDFVFSEIGRTLHVRNAPSPAATSSLAIAVNLADRLERL